MKKIILIVISVNLLICCNKKKQQDDDVNKGIEVTENKHVVISYAITKDDSLLIEKLVRNVYEWNEKNIAYYFDVGVEDQNGEKYIGIDWDIYEDNKELLKKSGMFSDIFIASYRKVLEQIDEKVKNKEYDYDWVVGEYPPFGTGVNEWCHCQDTPNDYYWNDIQIKDIKVIGSNKVSLTWNWGLNTKWSNGFSYPMEVKKENNTWRVTYLDGFNKRYY
ncbi:hypothetical protein JJL45_00345 [Tamlana sp. s12]|uniref:hypothetical protein n=1 Tax=Tamlana sp. s12 TaxID=1630406 RepID=UPI000AAE79CF|nr:hypothetical protein [Tamlana sp. s12]QQY82476.1 hypothetical protein JJL45_00345 [Tamlana sp. s12]